MFNTLFNWLPKALGMEKTQDEYLHACYRQSSGCPDQSRWGGYVDACQVSAGVYGRAQLALVVLGLVADAVGGYIALKYAKREILDGFIQNNTVDNNNQPVFS